MAAATDATTRSAGGTPCGACSPGSGLPLGPFEDLGAKPEFDAALTKVEHRSRHVAVALLVLEHGVAMGEAQKLCYALRVDQVIRFDPHNDASLHR